MFLLCGFDTKTFVLKYLLLRYLRQNTFQSQGCFIIITSFILSLKLYYLDLHTYSTHTYSHTYSPVDLHTLIHEHKLPSIITLVDLHTLINEHKLPSIITPVDLHTLINEHKLPSNFKCNNPALLMTWKFVVNDLTGDALLTSSRKLGREVVAVGQNLRTISSQAGLQLLNVLVTLTLSHRSFNYDTDHERV